MSPAVTPVVVHTPLQKSGRTLRLIGTPQTPKTLFERCQVLNTDVRIRARLFSDDEQCRSPVSRLSAEVSSDEFVPVVQQKRLFDTDTTPPEYSSKRLSGECSARKSLRTPLIERKQVNVNPFTPVGLLECQRKRPRNGSPSEYPKAPNDNNNNDNDAVSDVSTTSVYGIEELDRHAKIQRMYLSPNDSTYSRYEQEFVELDQIGSGEFGAVFKCIHRLDGCIYAIKKLKKPMQGSAAEKASLTEVWAHAVLGANTHVVRYYSAWAELNHMIIQNEFCNGGSLQDLIQEQQESGIPMSEHQLRQLGLHVANGLKFIHSQNLVHMDIKPGNIFISKKGTIPDDDENIPHDFSDEVNDFITYKIGDLGLVTSSLHPEVEEGDCRYMAPELLKDDYSNLHKADIFSLGLILYELGHGITLPKNGEEWQMLRKGHIKSIPRFSEDFNNLVKSMCDPDPRTRPSAQELVRDSRLVPYTEKSKAQLRMELNAERFKCHVLEEQLRQLRQEYFGNRLNVNFLRNPPDFLANRRSYKESKEYPPVRRSLFVGRGCPRSNSAQ
ncbi:wee1-like protein kinase [Galendromus occidentalis]|uniref:Wee1-like protein kinase n=1 Tax=Galendromus occidentalis TaxID=34638 RepID=A0AAJ6QU35_9ACAR|nr:wee1-like protein kinase [Galendromus occidentalis]